jgi:formylglycine-generating enzyme required for sulfatase activity
MHFRLPSEAEMEYAIRAGSKTRYPWGTDMNQACRWGNVADTFLSATDPAFSKSVGVTCNDGYAHTSPVGHYKPNAFGLYDMTGNVWVWTLDCWNDDHKDAPADGSARQSGNCAMHVLRGASWGSEIDWLRSADRGHYPTSGWDDNLGFRLARDL